MLYPKEMNIYGDLGNLLVLKKRLRLNGFEPNIIFYEPGNDFPKNVDIVLGGGGQDSGQDKIKDDLPNIKENLKALANNDVPMLLVCGMYQLFGNYYVKSNNEEIRGLSIFNLHTIASEDRHIGNIITKNEKFGEIIGYENHSGLTYLGQGQDSLSDVVAGFGNNGEDKKEGARFKNVIGTYLHGPLLPKNPKIADDLIKNAVLNKYGTFTPVKIENDFELKAREIAKTR